MVASTGLRGPRLDRDIVAKISSVGPSPGPMIVAIGGPIRRVAPLLLENARYRRATQIQAEVLERATKARVTPRRILASHRPAAGPARWANEDGRHPVARDSRRTSPRPPRGTSARSSPATPATPPRPAAFGPGACLSRPEADAPHWSGEAASRPDGYEAPGSPHASTLSLRPAGEPASSRPGKSRTEAEPRTSRSPLPYLSAPQQETRTFRRNSARSNFGTIRGQDFQVRGLTVGAVTRLAAAHPLQEVATKTRASTTSDPLVRRCPPEAQRQSRGYRWSGDDCRPARSSVRSEPSSPRTLARATRRPVE
jgi:hypothetical protein